MFPGAPKTTAGSSCRMRPKQQLLQAKRDRTHATTANDHEECDKKSSDDMDLADHRREATRIQNRRSIPLGSRGEVPTPQEGKAGPLEHSLTSALETAQHLCATFCTPQWSKKHKKNMKINKVVVMYLDTGEIVRLHLRMCQQSRASSRRTHFCFLALPGTMP